MTKQEAIQVFKQYILPSVILTYGKNDKPAKAEAWNDYTDALCKNGQITVKQYNSWSNPF